MPSKGCIHPALIVKSLPLEADAAVCVARIGDQAHQPFDEVPYIEEYVQHLLHLPCMVHLVIEVHGAHFSPTALEDDAEQVDGLEPLEGDDAVQYYPHGDKGNKLTGNAGIIVICNFN